MSKIAVVINPVSGGGRGKKAWNVIMPGLHALFDEISYRMSNQVDNIDRLTADLIKEDPDYCLIIGGDGTLSHAVNGLFHEDKLINPRTRYAYFNSGCGGDFARQFPRQKVTEFLDRLVHRQAIETNVGKISFPHQQPRYFINIASCGLSAHVVAKSINSRWLKKLGGSVNYFVNALLGLMTYHKAVVQLQFDENPPIDTNMFLMAVCNGQYFGGRMHVAPMANLHDDLLDVVIFHNFSRLAAVFKFIKIYFGKHLLEKQVQYIQAKKVRIEAQETRLAIEADGELAGYLPACFELINEKLELIV
ncbi:MULTISPECIES: diacylglycerol kinase family protein [unclassified Legionella]|uniref:diacylglycerol/lipid kinase family protein n=1 Tax=unclassified Legionella TaxID=2622702 RepID=UPI0010564660|nr:MULTISPECIES: YegS/Rv2252/BmrU family lipid kinase [unclassified Legionella]MDI9818076.1 YegS/Rv2252/BmrU family lipid kinase [Legionella sp. PL877]